jgi:para-nitrobenzyl esterase
VVNLSQVRLRTGRLEGAVSSDGRVRAFLGIPYAAPPVGALRWRAPEPAAPWSGTRSALSFGPSAPQPPISPLSFYAGGESRFDEDCLTLNVWTGPSGSTGRPVLVWFHFGGFQFGSSANPLYDGAELARAGLTVVTVNYRLGRLGFLAHPALSAESDSGVSGNYGVLDQIAALEWVRDNVASLGGDPGCVTIGGVSAGGHSVHNLRASDQARGLFHRAVVHSGPGLAPPLDGPGHPAALHTLEAGAAAGEELGQLLGAMTSRQLRDVPVDQLVTTALPRAAGAWRDPLAPQARTSMHAFDSSYPVVDGHVIREAPVDAYRSGRAIDVPMLVGGTDDEGMALPYLTRLGDYEEYVAETFGVRAGDVLACYPAATDDDVAAATRALGADHVFSWSAWTSARLQSRHATSPVWLFEFRHRLPIPARSQLGEKAARGAVHAADVPYLFGSFGARDFDWTDVDRGLGDQVRAAWVAFARTGDPNGDGPYRAGGPWRRFHEGEPTMMIWDSLGGHSAPREDTVRMQLFDGVLGLVQPTGSR